MQQVGTMRRTAKQRAYETVKRELLEGVIRPGDRISDADICARLRVSRTPVREALLALERDGLVRVIPRQGYFASDISVRDAIDAYQVRMILEPIVTAMAAERITPKEVDALRALVEDSSDDTPAGFLRVVERNRAFHVGIASASGNLQLAGIMADVMDKLTRLAYVELRSKRTVGSWREEHLGVLDALAGNDPANGARRVREASLLDDGLLPLRARHDLIHFLNYVHEAGESGSAPVASVTRA